MSGTDAREQADGPVVPEPAAPGGVQEMSGPLVPAPGAGHSARVRAAGQLPVTQHRRGRRGWVAVVVVIVLAGSGVGGAAAAGAFSAAKPAASGNAYATSTFTVRRGPLTEQTQEDATLGSAGSYTVVVPGSSSGGGSSLGDSGEQTFTALPQTGQIIRQEQVLYETNESPVVLLYGSVPAYRGLSEGMTGGDVRELNADLVKLGYAAAAVLGRASGWNYFSSETAYALELLQSHLGLTETGSLPLGQAVFLPSAIQVTGLGTGALSGGPAAAGSTVLTGSSLTPVVTIDLDASLQTEVAVGNKVSITLPDGSVTPGVISQIATVASSSPPANSAPGNGNGNGGNNGNGNSGSGPATITVLVSLTDPKAAGTLNQAPVEVTITTGSVSNVLIVPVDALLAQPAGGYAVEVTGPGGHHLVTVTPGLFDDAAGTVQVTGNLTPGQHVVVPGI
jgi:hypothetical protein